MQLTDNAGQLYRWFSVDSRGKGGYGFIKFEGRNVFVHTKNYVSGHIPEVGQKVAFDFGLSHDPNKPPQAVRVRVLASAQMMKAEADTKAALELKAKLEALAKAGVS
jgi:cold shock CspA family protein